MKAIIRFILRVLFWPFGASLLLATGAFEFIQQPADWDYWRRYNDAILQAMWLHR